jgi:hypothetical protein
MSTWYQVDRTRWALGKISAVEVEKETEKCVFVTSGPKAWSAGRYNKDSGDYHFFPTREQAVAKAIELIESRNVTLQDEMDRNLERLAEITE